jgi:hypothetical protein
VSSSGAYNCPHVYANSYSRFCLACLLPPKVCLLHLFIQDVPACLCAAVLQLTFLEDQLPYLIPTAREALRGMDRKPISDLVS